MGDSDSLIRVHFQAFDVDGYEIKDEDFLLEPEDYKSILDLLHHSSREREREQSVDERVVNHIKYGCSEWNDIWRVSIYGNPRESDRAHYHDTKGDHSRFPDDLASEDEIPDIEITTSFLEGNYCAVTANKGAPVFCENCKKYYRKVKYFLDRSALEDLADDWYLPYEDREVILNTQKRVQSKQAFLEANPEFKEDANWKTFKFDDYFDEDLTRHIGRLQEYDVIHLGHYFRQSVEPLLQLPRLKGLIFGFWFTRDIGDLKPLLSHLQFIRLPKDHKCRIDDELYKITYHL